MIYTKTASDQSCLLREIELEMNERCTVRQKNHQTASILQNTLKVLMPLQDDHPFDKNIVGLAKVIHEKLRSLQLKYSDVKATNASLRTEAAISKTLLNKLGQEHSARIE